MNHGMLGWALIFPLFAGCVTPQYIRGEWPEGVPHESYYKKVYVLDEENQKHQSKDLYLTWILRFYKGYQIAPGWHALEGTILKNMTEEEYNLLAPKMAYLGQMMSSEWAKSKEVRVVNTTMLQIWGATMRKARKLDRTEETIARILADVKGLLRRELEAKDISMGRYKDLTDKKFSVASAEGGR